MVMRSHNRPGYTRFGSRCGCICHRQPGVRHFFACCSPNKPSQGIEARSGETEGLDRNGESPVSEGNAPEKPRPKGDPQVTSTEETQALLPVTQADRDAAGQVDPANRVDYKLGRLDGSSTVQALARHRISHSLPGDVGKALPEYGEWLPDLWDAYLGDLVGWEDRRNWANLPATFRWHEFYERILAALTPSATISEATKRMEQTLGAKFQATPSALSPEPVQKLHELPEGHRWCCHCEQKDPHCSVCEGVGYLPNTDPSALSGDAGEGE